MSKEYIICILRKIFSHLKFRSNRSEWRIARCCKSPIIMYLKFKESHAFKSNFGCFNVTEIWFHQILYQVDGHQDPIIASPDFLHSYVHPMVDGFTLP